MRCQVPWASLLPHTPPTMAIAGSGSSVGPKSRASGRWAAAAAAATGRPTPLRSRERLSFVVTGGIACNIFRIRRDRPAAFGSSCPPVVLEIEVLVSMGKPVVSLLPSGARAASGARVRQLEAHRDASVRVASLRPCQQHSCTPASRIWPLLRAKAESTRRREQSRNDQVAVKGDNYDRFE